jgi:Tol biopolymer transport system component
MPSRRRKSAPIAIALALGAVLVLALAVASPGSGGVSAVGTCNTTLAQAAAAGDDTITVGATTGCDIGDTIILNQGGATEECQEIEKVGALTPALELVGALASAHSSGETVVEVAVCPTPTPTETETPPPTETPTPTPTPTPIPTAGLMYDCPQAGKWAMAVWEGEDGIDTGEALATCGEGAVDSAYALDPDSQMWRRWFPDRPEISSLMMLENMQGLFVLGSSMASPMSVVGPPPLEPGQVRGCPLPGVWSIAVWDGPDDTEAGEALGTCGEGELDFAYALDPDNQMWLRYFPGHPEFSSLLTLKVKQGFIAHGTAPAVSRIAFASDRDGDFEIYVMNADGSGQTQLTYNDAFDGYPAWSPDRTKIAFQSDREWANGAIYVMNADGTDQHSITTSPGYHEGQPAWSPDGTKIAFVSDREEMNYEIFVMNADGSEPRRLTYFYGQDGDPSWSPDGTKIAFSSSLGGPDEGRTIFVISANPVGYLDPKPGLTQLTKPDPYSTWSDSDPVWSPDGTKIAFTSTQHGRDIWVMNADGVNADGTGQTRLTADPASDWMPAWSPGGTKIAFVSDREPAGNFEIYVMNADGMGKHNLTNNGAYDRDPAWAP